MGASLHAVIDYLQPVDPKMAAVAKCRYGCLEPWVDDPSRYGLASLRPDFACCKEKSFECCRISWQKRLEYASRRNNGEELHSAEQNAELVCGCGSLLRGHILYRRRFLKLARYAHVL